jgi:protein MpaA
VLILGGIHGDEPSSSELVLALQRHLLARPGARWGRKVVLVPAANPDGLRLGTRENSRGIDLNRNFPAANFTGARRGGRHPGSEPETRALLRALAEHEPSLVVSVHAPLACVDPDGGPRAHAIARSMARAGGLPVGDLATLPGSLGSYVSTELHRIAITYELADRRLPPDEVGRHVRALLVAIREGGGGRLGGVEARW